MRQKEKRQKNEISVFVAREVLWVISENKGSLYFGTLTHPVPDSTLFAKLSDHDL